MTKIEEIINYIRSNTNIPNYGVFIITGLLLDKKKYEEINNIYDFLTKNLKKYQEMDLIEFDNFLVENNMYKNTYYTKNNFKKNNNELIKINKEEELNQEEVNQEELNQEELSQEDIKIPRQKIYASDKELNIKYNVNNIINLSENDIIGWSGTKIFNKDCEENLYYFYQLDQIGFYQKAIIFSY